MEENVIFVRLIEIEGEERQDMILLKFNHTGVAYKSELVDGICFMNFVANVRGLISK